MRTWIALFRGINVGGNNILPMAELKSELESIKLRNIRTYIQSGNVVFEADAKNAASLSAKISKRIETSHGFRPQILVLEPPELLSAIDANPFPGAVTEPKTLHFFFLAEPAAEPHLTAIRQAKSKTESFELTDRVFYLHAPDGIGRSKLAGSVEKYLGVPTTARNYNTVDKLRSLVDADST